MSYISATEDIGTAKELPVPEWPDTKTLVSATSSVTYERILKKTKL